MKRLFVLFFVVAIAGCGPGEGDTGLDFDENDIDAAAETLKSENEFARQKAARALGQKGSEASSKVPDLLAVATNESESDNIRAEAIKAIGLIGTSDQATIDAIKPLAEHKSKRQVREAAKDFLASHGQ